MDNIKPQRRVIGKNGDSLYVTIPADVIRKLNLKKGDSIMIGESDGKVIASPVKSDQKDRINLIDKLMAEHHDAMDYLQDK
ncbi:hypothetical protein IV38_GL001286 [Lactobacillus selangorensis]|uniref:SpoVT-AbrB domain-containing protein n=1 Tax=Lactobacillus selangorensis TaxID=81857 RepID=A0A0R2FN93_9LACO|nr:AbrB/MazE/SpoVT family DNA-binding domain-containing protein [Lactobacillus selangorensis]KRN29070.1 hypothetical protein IV38_GL001286 [Lactobacillus selangorensis]KRN30018.1 hypothetical protein IV40_GL002046 [Lactobacillus selangorensis]